MLDYLQKFSQLPKELKEKISAPNTLVALEDLEKQSGLALAGLVIRLMTREIELADLPMIFQKQGLIQAQTKQLTEDLKTKVLAQVLDYLTLPATAYPAEVSGQPVKGAAFFFSPEDEEEIRDLTKQYADLSSQQLASQIETALNQIITQANINFGSQNLIERFEQILKTYLRGIRDRIEIRQTLTKPVAAGGLSFDQETAEKVLVIADRNLKNLGKVPKVSPASKIKAPELDKKAVAGLASVGTRDFEYDLATSLAQRVKASKMESASELPPPPPAVITPQVKTPTTKTELAVSSQPQTAQKVEIKIATRPKVEPVSKVKIEDIKYIPRVMSPIDELKFLDLTNFRRLDLDPQKASSKILGKIKLLEEESYGKRLEGIKAWRASPANKLYLLMGQESISKSLAIDAIIQERKKAGQEYLTGQEFEVISDLNKSLRF